MSENEKSVTASSPKLVLSDVDQADPLLATGELQCTEQTHAGAQCSEHTDPIETLEEHLRQTNKPVDHKKAVSDVIAICGLLEERRAVHGDLTPRLIVIGATGAPREIDDFRGGWLDPLFAYRSPELRKGKRTAKADVYSLGVMLLEMLTNGEKCIVRTRKHNQPLTPKDVDSNPIASAVPFELRRIIKKCLCSEVSRYKSASDLKKELVQFASGIPKTSSHPLGIAASLVAIAGVATWIALHQAPPFRPITYGPPPGAYAHAPEHNEKPLEHSQLAAIGKHDVSIILDRSGSMSTNDCATSYVSSVSTGRSRWDWAENELEIFSKQTEKALPDGFTTVVFNGTFQETANCKLADLPAIYGSNPPGGSTLLAPALEQVIKEGIAKNKPLAAVVMTDGGIGDPVEVAQCIARLHEAHPNYNMRVAFLLVGNGYRNLTPITTQLQADGVTDNLIYVVPWEKVSTEGIAHSLAEVIADGEDEQKK